MTSFSATSFRRRALVCCTILSAQGLFWSALRNDPYGRNSDDIQRASRSLLAAVHEPLLSVSNTSASNFIEEMSFVGDNQVPATMAPMTFAELSIPSFGPRAPEELSYTVESGETLSGIWTAVGAPSQGGVAAAKALLHFPSDQRIIREGESLTLRKVDGDIVELRKRASQGATLILSGSSQDGYKASVVEANLIEKEKAVGGTVFSSFSASAKELDLPYELVDDFVDLFSNRVEFRKDIQPGDTFSVIFTEQTSDDNKYSELGVIKAASLKLGDKFFAVVRDVDDDGTVRYYDENGHVPGNFFLRYPLQFSRISSTFATARFHPVLNKTRPHNGVDFAAPTGTPVRSIGDGTVISAGYSGGGGNMVRIQHCDRYTTEYMHLSKFAPGLKVGDKVARGEVIGSVGMTGLATGPHLHFGMFDRGQYIDPMDSNLARAPENRTAPPAILAELQELRRHHDTVTVAAAAGGRSRVGEV